MIIKSMEEKKITVRSAGSKRAFSLMELMFALLAISVFLAAFAPVISNKFSKETDTISSSGQLITTEYCDKYFANSFNLSCSLCYHEEACVSCSGDCPKGMTKNKERCTCQ